ncbi:hypothetical protein BGP_6523 [Beggiatoa sp. PS]|nr:hypothetical protein BGP_6523 [Beggiatoa sp. PS]
MSTTNGVQRMEYSGLSTANLKSKQRINQARFLFVVCFSNLLYSICCTQEDNAAKSLGDRPVVSATIIGSMPLAKRLRAISRAFCC